MRKILILGATSSIAEHTARLFAARKDRFCLVARDRDRLEAVAQDLRARGADRVETIVSDLSVIDRHIALWRDADRLLEGIDTVLIAYGMLPDQRDCEKEFSAAAVNFQVNFLSVVSLLTIIAEDFERRGQGCIAVISSVAGDRGRQSNYVYGSAKAALTVFLQGLRNRLNRSKVSVITIKPGLVKTPMTAHLKPSLLFSEPAKVARGIYDAIQTGKDVVYLPGYWRWIMTIIKLVPETVFKRTKL